MAYELLANGTVARETCPARGSAGAAAVYRIILRDFQAPVSIGVHPHEQGRTQQVRINVELAVRHPGNGFADDIDSVMSYEDVVAGIRRLTGGSHITLIETLATRIGELCLTDQRVLSAQVRVEKLEVFPEAEAVGVSMEFRRSGAGPAEKYT